MWDLCPLDVLKLLASVLTPLAIAASGYFINRTIQRRSEIAQRQSSWRTKWADDFLKSESGFNESAKKFMWLYVTAEWKAMDDLLGAVGESKISPDEVSQHLLELNKGWVEISMFVGFAPNSGEVLKKAASDLLGVANNWRKNGQSNVREFLQKLLTFNKNARKVHAELLGLSDSKN